MKKLITYHFIFAFFIAATLHAQDIHCTVTVTNASCNALTGGSVDVDVTETNPPYTYLWNTGNTENHLSGAAPGNYSLTVTDSAGHDTLIHIAIGERACTIGPGLVFTPNGDGHKDTWAITNIEYFPENLILVYNRWGQKVYEHRGVYEPWDGTDLLGVPVPDNSYFYIIYKDHKDEGSIIKGCVSIVR